MRDELSPESKSALIAYRIERATDTLKEAELLRGEGYYNATINRLYYACYYAVVALLLQHDIQANSHSGVKSMFGLHFVATGKIPIKIGKTFATLFEKRHSSDYDDFIFCDKEMIDELFPQAETFITELRKHLQPTP